MDVPGIRNDKSCRQQKKKCNTRKSNIVPLLWLQPKLQHFESCSKSHLAQMAQNFIDPKEIFDPFSWINKVENGKIQAKTSPQITLTSNQAAGYYLHAH